MAVYFLSATGIPAIKIGHSAMPQKRLLGCQVWSPVKLRLDAWDDAGDALTEAELLWRFRADRMHGEWFAASGALQDLVVTVAETGKVPGAWYSPEGEGHCDVVSGYYRAPRAEFYQSKFGLTRKDLMDICGPWSMQAPYLGLPAKYLPLILNHLNSNGWNISHHDLFPMSEQAA